jgi:hypothetical protein
MPIAKGGRCTSSLWYVRTWRWNAVRSQGVKEQEQTSPWYLSFSLISLFYRNVMTRCYYIYYSCGFFPTRFPLRFSFFFIFFLFDAKQSERGYPPTGTLRDKGETAPLIKTLFSPFVLCQTLFYSFDHVSIKSCVGNKRLFFFRDFVDDDHHQMRRRICHRQCNAIHLSLDDNLVIL